MYIIIGLYVVVALLAMYFSYKGAGKTCDWRVIGNGYVTGCGMWTSDKAIPERCPNCGGSVV